MILSRVGRSISRSTRPTLFHSSTIASPCTGLGPTARFTAGFSSRPTHTHLGFLNGYASSLASAKQSHPSFPTHNKLFSTSAAAAATKSNVEQSGSIVSRVPKMCVNALFHLEEGVKEIIVDYVHHDVTCAVVLIGVRLFFLLLLKDVFVSLFL